MNFFHALNRKDVSCRLASEFVGTVAGADGDRQSVNLSFFDELSSLIRVGQKLITCHFSVSTVAVFFVALHGFQRAKAAEFAFYGNADLMSHVDDFFGDVDVVVKRRDRLAVAHQRAVHHYRRESEVDGALANSRTLAVVLMHTDRNMRIGFNSSLNQVLKENFTGILTSAGRSLHDDGRVYFVRSLHDGLNLFKIINVESRNTVVIFCCVIKELTQRHESHVLISEY